MAANAHPGAAQPPVYPHLPPDHTRCFACSATIPNRHWTSHLVSSLHRSKERTAQFKSLVILAGQDKNGVTVSHRDGVDFGIVDGRRDGRRRSMIVTVNAATADSAVKLGDVKFVPAHRPGSASPFSLAIPQGARAVQPSPGLSITVNFLPRNLGRYEERIELVFRDTARAKKFVILRTLKGVSGDPAVHTELRPTAPYVRPDRTRREPVTEVVPGVRAPSLGGVKWLVKLLPYPIPAGVASTLELGPAVHAAQRVRDGLLPPVLDEHSHATHFEKLLWVEERQLNIDMQIYDMANATLGTQGNCYRLLVPGLAEKRPSVLVGDNILVQRQGDPAGRWYEGGVHDVLQTEVALRFSPAFRRAHTAAARYAVRFTLNRIPLRRQHQALGVPRAERRVLFPAQEDVAGAARPVPQQLALALWNPLVGANEPQLQAVAAIVSQAPGAAPFVIFGPPGTGKTITAVEAILQLLRRNPDARILACAPSNSAADILAARLAAVLAPAELFRMYAPSRARALVSGALLPYTHPRGGVAHFGVPPAADVARFRAVVCTCVSAAALHGIRVPRGHFTHIFVDEAGQATEPEVMVAVRTMADAKTNIVLSGDPKQLGPIIRSKVAGELGLGVSYLERLMGREVYGDAYRGITVVKLVKNFRSHAAIIDFPNGRFYGGELIACGAARTIDAYIGWAGLPSPKFPVIFHSTAGGDTREASSPSFFNVVEADQVVNYVKKLRNSGAVPITDEEIGIVTPYNAQCLKIRTALRTFASGIKVGSVEEFQGQERKVIIISTVRSSADFTEFDLRHTLGFVSNPQRFNVAVTRAQALLIVIGDPTVLGLDPLWRSFLNFVHARGGWTGARAIPWDPAEVVREDGGYDEEMRGQGEAAMGELARRVQDVELDAGLDGDGDGDV